MLTYWEWAASKGISYRTTSTEKEYHEYLAAAGEPVEPYVPPPPTPPKVTVVNRLQAVKVAGIRPRPAYSRVLTLNAVAKFQGNAAICLSEAISTPFIVLDVWVNVFWMLVDTPPELWFRLTTGVGTQVDNATVRAWEPVVPVLWEGAEEQWRSNEGLNQFHWSMDRRYTGQARRLALWTELFAGGVGIASVYASYRIAEG